MGYYKVRNDNGKSCALFESHNGKLWPMPDDVLEYHLGRDVSKELVTPHARCIGRIFLNSIACNFIDKFDNDRIERFPIADHVLPNVFRRYLLQLIKPTNPKYQAHDLLEDVLDYTISQNADIRTAEHDSNVSIIDYFVDFYAESKDGNNTERLREAFEGLSINSRSIVLDGILQGLGYNGACAYLPFLGEAQLKSEVFCMVIDSRDLSYAQLRKRAISS